MNLNYPTFSLQGRKALVTGASRGIGQALAQGLAHAGADVAVAARNEQDLQASLTAIRGLGRKGVALSLDVTDLAAIRTGVDAACQQLGGLDILINNAGIEQVCPSLDVDEALWDRILDTNLKGAFFCAQAAARIMTQNAGGSIVNVCSLTSEVGVPTATPYGSSKSGLLGMTRALATEWARHDIRVNAIAPGYFRTALTEVFYQDDNWQQAMLEKIPQRRFGKLEDLLGAVVFLCADSAAYINGQMLTIDGGYMASI
ncbi:MAG: glucose 1-dehydrogenase [Gammaproteobacteria bacterium]